MSRLCILVVAIGLGGCFGRSDVQFTYHVELQAATLTAPANGEEIALGIRVVNYAGAPMPNTQTRLDVVTGRASVLQPGVSDANGLAQATVSSTLPGNVIVRLVGTNDGIWDHKAPEMTLTFAATAPPGNPTISVLAAPTQTQVGQNARVTTRILDGNNMPFAGVPVLLSASDSNAQLSSTAGITDAAGTLSVTMSDTHAGNVQVTATATRPSGPPIAAQVTVQFLAGPLDAAHSSLVVAPNPVAADNVTPTYATLRMADAYGNAVTPTQVNFNADGASTRIVTSPATSDANGTAVVQVYSDFAQSENITAISGGITFTARATFSVGAPSAAQSTLVASPNALVADGASITNLTLTVKDTQGNAIGGLSAGFSATGSGTGLPANANTNASGVAAASYSSTVAGLQVVSASVGGMTLNANVLFKAGGVATAHSSITANPTSVVADGTHFTTVMLTLADAFGNAVSGHLVTFVSSDPLSVVSGSPVASDANGFASATVRSVHAATTTQTAMVDNTNFTTPVAFTPGAPAMVTLTATPNSIVANGAQLSAVTFTVFDAQGNPNPNQTVTISGGNAGGHGTPATGTTDANGAFGIGWSSTLAGVSVLSGQCGALQQNVTVTTTPGPTVGFTVAGLGAVFQGQSVSATVRAVDANQNVTPGYIGTVTFTSSDVSGVWPANHTYVAADNGVYSTGRAITFVHSGAQTFTVADTSTPGITGNANVAVTKLNLNAMALESRASAAQCLALPGFNNQVNATLTTSVCAFRDDQIFALGNDGAWHIGELCVEVANAAYGNGATVQLNTCNGKPEQGWSLSGNTVQATGNANFCLDAVTPPSATVVLNTCGSATSQQWVYHPVQQEYALQNATTNRAVDVRGANFVPNNPLNTYVYNGTASQQFNMGPDGSVYALPASGTAYCMEVPSANYVVGAKPLINPCDGSAKQSWMRIGHSLRPRAAQALCLDFNIAAPVGQPILLSTCDGSATQQTALQALSSHYKFVSRANLNLCVTNPTSQTSGAAVTVNTCANTYRQQFRESSQDNNSLLYAFVSGGLVWDAGATPVVAGSAVTLQDRTADPNSNDWLETPVNGGFAFVSEYTLTLSLDTNTITSGAPFIVNTYSATDTQVFYKWPVTHAFTLQNAPTQCLGVSSLTPGVGDAVTVQPCNSMPNQQWTWMPTTGAWGLAGLCLDVVGQTFAPGATFSLNTCNATGQQHWSNNGIFPGQVIFFNGGTSSDCLDTNGSTATGAPLTLQTCSSATSQHFLMQ